MKPLNEPLTPPKAKQVILRSLAIGDIRFSKHALEEMEKDGITQHEAIGILRSGVVEPAEFEKGSWRHRVRARRSVVVVTFRSEATTVVVTAWKSQ